MTNAERENSQAQDAWNTNAQYWDERMADGNDFFNVLLWPSVERMLSPVAGRRVLDVACGNGLTSRRLAHAGAKVTAIDFSEEMIRIAKAREDDSSIEYLVVDATDDAALRKLGAFDGVLCNMALMDLADIRPLMKALSSLLTPDGRFVFSVVHPCFNNPAVVQVGEVEDQGGKLVTTYSVKVSRYLTPYTQPGLAMRGQPVPHPYFHRPLSALLAPGLEAGLVLDGLEERAFPPENVSGRPALSWDGRFSEIPPALVGRMRLRWGFVGDKSP
ncbi:MAG: class I SAM-dependent methyltransferase [Anaerolineales bacterium]|nr:class I SAM-dependent methyltransferase [Anaerolineales bacterium]